MSFNLIYFVLPFNALFSSIVFGPTNQLQLNLVLKAEMVNENQTLLMVRAWFYNLLWGIFRQQIDEDMGRQFYFNKFKTLFGF